MYNEIKKEGIYIITLHEIIDFLKGQDSYTLYRQNINKFHRNRVISNYIDQFWQSDLLDFSQERFKKANQGNSQVLVTIDVLSKYCWLRSVRSKASQHMVPAMRSIFVESGRVPIFHSSDGVIEFNSKPMKELYQEFGVKHFVDCGTFYSSVVERANRTITSLIFKKLEDQNSYNYMDILESVAHQYNHTTNSRFHLSPAEVNKTNESTVWRRLHLDPVVSKSDRKITVPSFRGYKYNIGDFVRITRLGDNFSCHYDANFTHEHFKVIVKHKSQNQPMYTLQDVGNPPETITGRFYENEMTSIKPVSADKKYKVEKVLRTRGRGRNQQNLVHWLCWPRKFDSFEPKTSIINPQMSKSQ